MDIIFTKFIIKSFYSADKMNSNLTSLNSNYHPSEYLAQTYLCKQVPTCQSWHFNQYLNATNLR